MNMLCFLRICSELKLRIFLLCIILFSNNTYANSYELKWFNNERKCLIKIDLKTNKVYQENSKQKSFEYIGNLETLHPEITSLDCNYFVIKEFTLKNKPVLSIIGTSLVYHFVYHGNKLNLFD